jgi:hypothetical protein
MEALDKLLAIITDGVADIKRVYLSANQAFPSLDEPYYGPDALDGQVAHASALVVAAAQQLIAMVRLPTDSVHDTSYGVRTYFVHLRLHGATIPVDD